MNKIHHRNLELNIGQACHCDDYLQLKVAGYFTSYNNITIASRRGDDNFFLAARGPKTDLSEAVLLSGRYLVIGDTNVADSKIFQRCVLQNKADTWLEAPDSLYLTRLLIAGAIRIVVSNGLTNAIAATPEFKQAQLDGRVVSLSSCE